MGQYSRTEMAVGSFVLLGCAALAYLSISIGGISPWSGNRYAITARFANVGDLSAGAVVKLAGVPVGEVREITLDRYAAEVTMRIDGALQLPADTIASVKTEGLLGEAYVSLSPGASEENLKDGGRVTQTEPPLDLFELIEKYAFHSDDDGPKPRADARDGGAAPSPFPDPLE